MARDFRTDQLRGARIIASGAFPAGTSPPGISMLPVYPHLGMLIYSSSAATNTVGGIRSEMLTTVGSDAWLVIDGTANNKATAYPGIQRSAGSSVIFLGDIVVSGTIWGERQIIDVDNTVPGDFHVQNDAYVSGSFAAGTTTAGASDTKDLIMADHSNKMVSFRIFDSPFPVIPPPTSHLDVFFWVSGSAGGMGLDDVRTVACFDGDLMVSGNLGFGPCTTFKDNIVLSSPSPTDRTSPPTLIFGPQGPCAHTPNSGSISVNMIDTDSWWFDMAHSGSADTAGGIRLKVRDASSGNEKAFALSGSGDIGINPGSVIHLAGNGWHGSSAQYGPQIFASASVGTDADTRGRGVQVTFGAVADSTNKTAGAFKFVGGVITASNGIYLPTHAGNDSPVVGGARGETRGIMFSGGGGSAPGAAGLYFNSATAVNQVLGGVTNTMILTSSTNTGKMKLGAGGRIDITSQGDMEISTNGGGAGNLNILSNGGAGDGTLFLSGTRAIYMGAGVARVNGSNGIELLTMTGSTGGIILSAPKSTLGINLDAHQGAGVLCGIHLNASGTSGGKVISGLGTFGMTLDATGSQIAMLGDVHMMNNLTVHGDFIKGHIITASVGDPLLLLNSGSVSRNSGGGIAIASGSTVTNQSLVFGRDTVNENTFLVGRLDVEDGLKSDLTSAVIIPIHAAGFRNSAGMILSSSTGWPAASPNGVGAITHDVVLENHTATGAGYGGDIHIKAAPAGNNAPHTTGQLFVSASAARFAGDVHATGSLAISGSYVSIKAGSTLYFDESTTDNGPYSLAVNTATNLLQMGLGTGKLALGAATVYDASNFRLGINNTAPGYQLDVQSTSAPVARFANTNNDASGGLLRLENTRASGGGVADDFAGGIQLFANNNLASSIEYAKIVSKIVSPNETAEIGSLIFETKTPLANKGTPLYLRDDRVLILSGGAIASYNEASGADVSFYVSGAIGNVDHENVRGTSLFGGDLVVSGNAQFKNEVTASIVNVIGSLTASDMMLPRLSLTSSTADVQFYDSNMFIQKNSNNLEFRDAALGLTKTLTQLASLSVVTDTDVFSVTHGAPSYVVTSGSFSFDTDERATNATPAANGPGRDTYFFVSGSRGCRGTNDRGLALFAGDLHISGTITSDDSTFGGSFDDAYDSPSGGGTPTDGIGALCNVDNRPIQLYSGSNMPYYSTTNLMAISGSMSVYTMQIAAVGDPTSPDMTLALTSSAGSLSFKNTSSTRGAAEVFKLTGGSGNIQISDHATEGKLAFASESSTYIRLDNASSPKNLEIYNTTGTGKITLKTGASSGSPGTVEVQANVLPLVDNVYDLGSNAYRWANLYTGDLHLKNDRGDWTIYEEREMLVVVNNITGKKYKMNLTPLEDEE